MTGDWSVRTFDILNKNERASERASEIERERERKRKRQKDRGEKGTHAH